MIKDRIDPKKTAAAIRNRPFESCPPIMKSEERFLSWFAIATVSRNPENIQKKITAPISDPKSTNAGP
jgi:hypothetical protein